MPLMPSWLASANDPATDFPLNNLPCGVFSIGEGDSRCGMAIGDCILDLTAMEAEGLIQLAELPVFDGGAWNDFMELGPRAWARLRTIVTGYLVAGSEVRDIAERHLHPQTQAQLHMPFAVSGYTDFYSGRNHAFNVGTMFRGPENALPPNWLHVPIAYNGRASSVCVSGTDVRRPWGQLKLPENDAPIFAPSRRFDFELEFAAIVGQASEGMVSVAQADAMIFGYALMNDWSARDIQTWEYQPLGPFQAKATATTISPWIVMKAALEPFRTDAPKRDKPLLPYLRETGPMHYDIALTVELAPRGATRPTVITRTTTRELYYSPAQQLAHHTTSGCPMDVGDLLGSGTISGTTHDSRGSMLELSWGGAEPLTLASGETRSFLEDGDTVTIRGHGQGDGYRIGFGPCAGTVRPAAALPAGVDA